jgi:hypothetical protein
MKTYTPKLFMTLMIILTLGCQGPKIKSSEEIQALNEIFKDLTDSLIYYPAYPPPPPPSPPSSSGLDSLGKVFIDSLQKEYKALISKIDMSKFVISVTDSTAIDTHFKDRIEDIISDSSFFEYKNVFNSYLRNNKLDHLIRIDKITNTGRYKLLKSSSITGLENNFNYPKYDYVYFGQMTISQIYFDQSSTTGFLTCSVFCGRECSYSFLVIIKKIPIAWKIVKMKRLSIT